MPTDTAPVHKSTCACQGCRGKRNTAARRRYQETHPWAEPRGAQRTPRHGTRSRYVRDKCRCDECRAANTAYARERNRQRATVHRNLSRMDDLTALDKALADRERTLTELGRFPGRLSEVQALRALVSRLAHARRQARTMP